MNDLRLYLKDDVPTNTFKQILEKPIKTSSRAITSILRDKVGASVNTWNKYFKEHIPLDFFNVLVKFIVSDSKTIFEDLENDSLYTFDIREWYNQDDLNNIFALFKIEGQKVSSKDWDLYYEALKKIIEEEGKAPHFNNCTLVKDFTLSYDLKWKIISKSEINNTPKKDEDEKNAENIEKVNKGSQHQEYAAEFQHFRNEIEKNKAKGFKKLLNQIKRLLTYFFNKKSFYKYLTPQLGEIETVKSYIKFYVPSYFTDSEEIEGNNSTRLSHLIKETNQVDSTSLIDYLWDKVAFENPLGKVKYIFIISGVGQGKTVTMANLYYKWLTERKRDQNRILVFLRFDENIVSKLEQLKTLSLENKNYQITILLDGLDEDSARHLAAEERLRFLEREYLYLFNRVVITSRYQLFEHDTQTLQNTIQGIFNSGSVQFLKIRQFEQQQVEQYINNRYNFNLKKKERALEIVKTYGDDLMSRQMILTYLEDLLDHNIKAGKFRRKYQIYDYIISRWLDREHISHKGEINNLNEYKKAAVYAFKKIAQKNYKENKKTLLSNELRHGIGLQDKPIRNLDSLIKLRSIITRNTYGEWMFSHKTFVDYFTALSAYEDIEFNMMFHFQNDEKKLLEYSASDFFLEMFLENEIKHFKSIQNVIEYDSEFVLSDEKSETEIIELEENIGGKWKKVSQIDNIQNLYQLTNIRGWHPNTNPKLYFLVRGLKNLSHSIEIYSHLPCDDLRYLGFIPTLKELTLVNIDSGIDTSYIPKLFPELEKLTIVNSGLNEIEFVSKLEKLTYLNISENKINSLRPLKKLNLLRFLLISNPSEENYIFLSDLENTSLRQLSIAYDFIKIADIRWLKRLDSILSIRINNLLLSNEYDRKDLSNLINLGKLNINSENIYGEFKYESVQDILPCIKYFVINERYCINIDKYFVADAGNQWEVTKLRDYDNNLSKILGQSSITLLVIKKLMSFGFHSIKLTSEYPNEVVLHILSVLPQLRELNIWYFNSLDTNLIRRHSSLRTLHISHLKQDEVIDFARLENTNIDILKIGNMFASPRTLKVILNFSSLTRINRNGIKLHINNQSVHLDLRELVDTKNIIELQLFFVRISNIELLRNFEDLESLSLENISIENSKLKNFMPKSLKNLCIMHVKDFRYEDIPPNIESLTIHVDNRSFDSANLPKLKKLKKLEIYGYDANIDFISRFGNLEELVIHQDLEKLDFITSVRKLKKITLDLVPSEEVKQLLLLKELEEVNLKMGANLPNFISKLPINKISIKNPEHRDIQLLKNSNVSQIEIHYSENLPADILPLLREMNSVSYLTVGNSSFYGYSLSKLINEDA